ncbi:MAG: hypothetical protein CMJ33_04665 [Phycisphaerae bacterium]|nr:hypothetical protein [Phycisphaerae bacterium]HAW94727.1 hypothetical protein [Phycisphaerales bacterium]
MNELLHVFDPGVLGWAIIHFLWQGALIGVVAGLILSLTPSRMAAFRYVTTCVALALCVVTFMVTIVQLGQRMPPVATVVDASSAGTELLESTSVMAVSQETKSGTSNLAGLIAIAWTLGVALMGLRLIGQWRTTIRLRTGANETIDPRWHAMFDRLKARLGLSEGIRLLVSGIAETPMVLGWIRPVVMIPTAAFSTLTDDELKLVLLHELNHIRRMDHLINLLQGTTECLLFFHPVTWWLSNQIRNERELCCDDLTIQTMNQPRIFARALFKLETLRLEHNKSPLNTAIHATGGSLMSRITRMLESHDRNRTGNSTWKTPLALVLATGLTAVCLTTHMNSVDASETMVSEQDRGQKDDTNFPTAQEMRTMVGEKVRDGSISREQAGQMMQLHRRLTSGMENGTLSAREARAMMDERTKAIFEADSGDDRRRRGDSEQAMIDRMIDMVNAGEITREQMQQRLDRMNMRDELESEDELDVAIAQVEEMLETGMITRTQLLEGLRRMMSEFKRPAFTRADYAEAARKMAAMVEAGDITREQMQQRLDRMRMQMGESKSKAPTKLDYMEAEKKMSAMVKSGEITREQMQQRLDRMRMAMTEDSRKAKAPSRVEYMEAERKMTAMVKAGEITREQMQQRLERMKFEIERSMSKESKSEGFSRREYKEAQGRLMEMLEAGEITREQMQQRLDRMKAGADKRAGKDKAIGKDKVKGKGKAKGKGNGEGEAKSERAIPTPPEGLSRQELREWFGRIQDRLDMAVESGRMTREEAREMIMKIRSNMR